MHWCKFDDKNICFMDISCDKKWLCYVSQSESTPGEINSTLYRCKFTAFNDETSQEEECKPPFENDTVASPDSRVSMEDKFEPVVKSIPINKYFDPLSKKGYFLSISSGGEYIALSSCHEEAKDVDGECFVFKVEFDKIVFHHNLKCNGRAVFLNRENELCLAILSMESLKIYNRIDTFSEYMRYDEYDVRSFMSSNQSNTQFQLTGLAYAGTVSGSSHWYPRNGNNNWEHILGVSAYMKENILLKAYPGYKDKIEFWSLKIDGVRLTSIFVMTEAVIAISDDLKYAATIPSYNIHQGGSKYSSCVINIFNLENGCIVYTLRDRTPIIHYTHATFYCNSRHLALSGLIESAENVRKDNVFIFGETKKRVEVEAIFQVWNIENQIMIYSTIKKMEQYVDLPSRTLNKTLNVMNPFIFEEKTGDKTNMKGFYSHLDQRSGKVTMKCFPIDFNDHLQSSTIQWLIKDDLHLSEDLDFNGSFRISEEITSFNKAMEKGESFQI